VVMALKHACGVDCAIDNSRFVEISRYVGQASCRPVPEWKAIVGEKVFSHESGLHVDGVLKNPRNYEAFDPQEVGLSRYLVLGKHSGGQALLARIGQLGIAPEGLALTELLDEVRRRFQHCKSPISDEELLALCRDLPQVA
jgi:homocitrate synthase NifV